MANAPPATQKPYFDVFRQKIWKKKKSAVKYSIQKSILLNFVKLSTNFCPRLLAALEKVKERGFYHTIPSFAYYDEK